MEHPKSETPPLEAPALETQDEFKYANVRATDYFEKEFEKIPVAISLSKRVLTAEEQKDLDLEKLTVVKESLFDSDVFFQMYPDMVYRIPYKDSEKYLDLYILFEHKSHSDAYTVLQLYFYSVQIYLMRYKKHRETPNAGRFFLPEIIPVIYHTGNRPFRAAKNINEFFQDMAGKNKAKLNFEARIRDLAIIPTEELELKPNELEFGIVERLMQGIHKDDIYQRVQSMQEPLGRLAQDKANWDFLNLSFGFLGKNTDKISQDQYRQIFKKIEPKGDSNMISLFDQLEAKGRAEGEVRGKAKTLVKVLQTKFHAVPQSIIDRINEIRDSVVLESLVVSAMMSDSFDEFLKELN